MSNSLTKDNYKTHHSETAEDAKKGKNQVQKNQNYNFMFKDNLQDHNIGLILILTVLKEKL